LSSIRILIADDHRGWRRQVRVLLQPQLEWQVIAEAADGPEVIQKADELKPDLIVLDIGLPKVHGIEAARQIRQLSPSSKIVFLSTNDDLDVVRAALATGAQGYVYKTAARSDLLSAIQAVLLGKRLAAGRRAASRTRTAARLSGQLNVTSLRSGRTINPGRRAARD
jgi:DNA-binding NarL/FixJ family response regulator